MERLTKTTLDQLQPGDRFYFCSDKGKIKKIFTLNIEHAFFKKMQVGFLIQYANVRKDQAAPDELQVEAHKANRYVIFLRHTQ